MLVIVCLSTIPSRVQYLPLTVKSLLEQTLKPDRIHIFIPKWSKKEQCEYPAAQLEEVKEYVHLVESDEGPITKLYPVFQLYPDAGPEDANMVVINVDDDKIYNSRTIESLLGAHLAGDNKKDVLGFCGWIMNGWSNVKFPSTKVRVDYGEATNGILYPMSTLRNIQNAALLAFEFLPEARGCDDLWISAWIQHTTPDCRIYAVPLLGQDLLECAKHKTTPAFRINSLSDNVTSVEAAKQNLVTARLRMVTKNQRVARALRKHLNVFHTPSVSVNELPSCGSCSDHWQALITMVIVVLKSVQKSMVT